MSDNQKSQKNIQSGSLNLRNSGFPSIPSFLKKGFTLVELLIAMGILSILLIIFSQVFVAIFSQQLSGETDAAVQQDTTYLFNRLTYDVAQASAIAAPALGATGQTLTLTVGGVAYIYSLSGTTLTLTKGAGTAVALNGPDTRISNVTFTTLGTVTGRRTVFIHITITGTTPLPGGRIVSRDIVTTVGVR